MVVLAEREKLLKNLRDLWGSSVSERSNAYITMRMALFPRLYDKDFGFFFPGSWNANVSEFCINNENTSS